jgi:hypothetical protein
MGTTAQELLSNMNSPCVDVKFPDTEKALADARAYDAKVRKRLSDVLQVSVLHKSDPRMRWNSRCLLYYRDDFNRIVLQVAREFQRKLEAAKSNASSRLVPSPAEFYPYDQGNGRIFF